MGGTIRVGQDIQCLLYAGFLSDPPPPSAHYIICDILSLA